MSSLVAEGTVGNLCTTEQTTSFDLRIKKHSGEISVLCLASGDTASLIGEQDEGRICRIFGHLDDWYGELAVIIERIEFKLETERR